MGRWGGQCRREAPAVACPLSPHPGLTKEPVLWTLASKEPPAPADGAPGAAHDGGQEAGLSLNWAVPNVLVKDVPNFEQLSPELEAGTAPPVPSGLTSRCPARGGPGAGDPAWKMPVVCKRTGLRRARRDAQGLLRLAPFTPHHNPSGPECFSSPISLMRKLKLREGKGLTKVSGPTTGGFKPKSVPEKARSLPTAQGRAEGAEGPRRGTHRLSRWRRTHFIPCPKYSEDGTEWSPLDS